MRNIDPDKEVHMLLGEAMHMARQLATSIWKREYAEDAPEWEPLDTPGGVISQIDNMIAGITKQRDDLLAENIRLQESRGGVVSVDGYKIMNAINEGGLFDVKCAHDESHSCLVIWSSGAPEQLEALIQST